MVITLVVLAILYGPDVGAALGALRRPDPGWLIAAIVLEMASIGLYARMQRRLLRGAGTRVPLRRAVGLAYAAHSMSITLPGGPLVSTAYNYRRMRAFGADSTVAAWATAASGVLSSIGLVVLSIAVGIAASAEDTSDALALGTIVSGLALLAGVVAVLRRRPSWRAALTLRLATIRARVPEAQRRRLDRSVTWAGGVLRVRIPPMDLAVAGAHSVGNWVTDAASLALCCAALGVAVDPVPLALTYIAGMVASGLPIFPGGLGTVDSVLIVGLVAGGAGASAALGVVVLYRLISMGLVGAIGWLLWLLGWTRRSRGIVTKPVGTASLRARSESAQALVAHSAVSA
jgi:uncharacterized membrane protein YbhN (UPF0104 family)